MTVRLLPCISVRQPWLWGIRNGKPVENRVTRRYRRDGTPICPVTCRWPTIIGLHASKGYDEDDFRDPRIKALWRDVYPEPRPVIGAVMGFGVIEAVATLVDVHYDAGCCGLWAARDQWHLVLANVRRIDPVPARGSLALPWTAPEDVAAAVWAQLEI